MNKKHVPDDCTAFSVYELECDSEKYTMFVENGYSDGSLADRPLEENFVWECALRRGRPFDASYKPAVFEFNLSTRKKIKQGFDFSASTSPFLIFSKRAKDILFDYLEPAGQFLDIITPAPGFIGFYPTLRIQGAFDLKQTEHRVAENGLIIEPSKEVMFQKKVLGHHLFMTEDNSVNVYVSNVFRETVEKNKLKGFWIWRKIPLV